MADKILSLAIVLGTILLGFWALTNFALPVLAPDFFVASPTPSGQ